MIEAKNIKKSFGEKDVLKGISATFQDGEVSLIIGKSGAGKTVCLKSIVGIIEPDSGEILYDKRNIYELEEKESKLLRQEVGMLFQGSALFDSMTIFENVLFPLEMFSKKTHKEKIDRARECLEQVQLTDARHKFPAEISGGMMKRAAIARAIALEPKYLFCDEPNSGLDPETSSHIDELILKITKDGNITTIINTHDMNSLETIGEHVLFLHHGLIDWEGAGKDIEKCNNQKLKNFVYLSKN